MTADAAARVRRRALTATTSDSRMRIVLWLARAEAPLLSRSALVLVGLFFGGVLIWAQTKSAEPLWWGAAWQIGEGQVILAAAVLIVAHLATGRARRDGLRELYDSCPVSAATRVLAHLASLIGAVAPSVLLLGVATVWIQYRGGVGTPSPAVLGGGVLLVIAAGAAGIALGARLPHPLAGVLGAVALFALYTESNQFPNAVPWLFPWTSSDQFSGLSGPLTGYPPGGAHVVELAGIGILAGVVAIALTVGGTRHRLWLATVAVVSAAVICVGAVLQMGPIPASDLNRLFRSAGNPSVLHRCTTATDVRYCWYPALVSQLPAVEAPVQDVIARLPARPLHQLTIAQVMYLSVDDPLLTHGHASQQLARWNAELNAAPANRASASAMYLTVGSWPSGAGLADARFALALGTAEWAVHLPPTAISAGSSGQACVPVDQAREAIAIWLAIVATHASTALLLQAGPISGRGGSGTEVHNRMVVTWVNPGENYGGVSSGPQLTADGYLLAVKMTGLPSAKVAHVLDSGWPKWLNWRTTDAQLAAALGVRAPRVNFPAVPTHTKPGARIVVGSPGPPSPVCT
jgi:hypothetical protein